MSITYTITKSVNDGTSAISKAVSYTGVEDERVSFSSTGATTGKEFDFNFTRPQLNSFYAVADAACTLTFNASTSTGTFTVPLVANEPKEWDSKCSMVNATTNFPAGDVTKLYLTAATTVNLEVRANRTTP